jgi:exonuclease VII small subunit
LLFFEIMKGDVAWFRQRIEDFHHSVRTAHWFLSELQDYRAEVRPFWNDRCAAEISQRYLAPMANDADTCLAALTLQVEQMGACATSFDEADTSFDQMMEIAREVEQALADANALVRSLDGVLGDAKRQADEASDLAKLGQSHIERANAVGNSR